MRSQEPESGTIISTAKAQHGTDDGSGKYVECLLSTHGTEDGSGKYVECLLSTHGTDDESGDERTDLRREFEAENGSDWPSRLSSRVVVGQAPKAYVRVAKFGVGQDNFSRSPSGG
ncbi:hypothetical protein PF002_g32930 [Phytophthora fragariae]|uniref:Uncharacterized protein n=1 Tax=Phytophthora fragariae TaxID=53985 RepID=A0A6A3V2Z2_9STRA|nr:hypothetical protein PF002_g32930 [Phytophthora fragariae]